jgi:2-polyprenyl-3-methyl-5-hydroxy-6-metoxy-1,4-benzoquinol methylase
LLEYTGERVIPELMKPTNGMLLEHIARYYFCTPYMKGRVLDIACGSGYGTHMIAKTCKSDIESILGVDIDPATIEYAQKTYYHPISQFEVVDAMDPELPEKLGTFDCIVSFETIEHVKDDGQFMSNLFTMLRPEGTLVLSTPFGAGRGQPTNEPFHIHQFTIEEFHKLVHRYRFQQIDMYYQRGVTFEPSRRNVNYPFGIAVCRK